MELTAAKRYAEQLAEWVSPYCTRVQIAGSVRREAAVCHDIDLVCIPKLTAADTDMFGVPTGPPKSLLREFLVEYVRRTTGAGWRLGRANSIESPGPGSEPAADGVNFLLHLPRRNVDLDVYAANEATWWTRLICRTGSAAHNIWMCERARTMGGHWDPQRGLTLAGKLVELSSEEDFYRALGVPVFFPPSERELPNLHRWERMNQTNQTTKVSEP